MYMIVLQDYQWTHLKCLNFFIKIKTRITSLL